MATVSINLDIPHLDPTSENKQRVKDLLLYALRDMVTNNGHLIDASRDFALAQLVVGDVTCPGDVPDEEVDAALEAAARELAKEAEVL
ncbi:MAG: hypothetical protein GWN58_33075 [Anaerolineae bacterium]|jgi:hypothetical protein|nr:hypothetical protein [Thermoplasmata archaeon]NIV34108.1 hypothetical protein [Anaerolineae bacterium]NIY05959.1 hypothetical protein [Thermoplasmata archaeon]